MATRYLPPGWTEEMLVTATPEQWDALTEEEYERVCERRLQDSLAISATNKVAIEAEAAAHGIIVPNFDLASFVEVIHKQHLQKWGFVVIRTAYGSEEQWTQFRKLWGDAMDDQMTPRNGEGIDEVRVNLTFEWVEDKAGLDGKDMNAVRSYVQNWLTHRELPTGLNHAVCLVVTEEAMQSQLDGSTSATFNYANRQNAPFVVVLDIETLENEEDGCLGHFKVAISSLLNEFFPALAGYDLAPEELMLSAEDGEIWFSTS